MDAELPAPAVVVNRLDEPAQCRVTFENHDAFVAHPGQQCSGEQAADAGPDDHDVSAGGAAVSPDGRGLIGISEVVNELACGGKAVVGRRAGGSNRRRGVTCHFLTHSCAVKIGNADNHLDTGAPSMVR